MLKSLKYKDFMVFYNAYMDDVRQSKAKELPGYILQRVSFMKLPSGPEMMSAISL